MPTWPPLMRGPFSVFRNCPTTYPQPGFVKSACKVKPLRAFSTPNSLIYQGSYEVGFLKPHGASYVQGFDITRRPQAWISSHPAFPVPRSETTSLRERAVPKTTSKRRLLARFSFGGTNSAPSRVLACFWFLRPQYQSQPQAESRGGRVSSNPDRRGVRLSLAQTVGCGRAAGPFDCARARALQKPLPQWIRKARGLRKGAQHVDRLCAHFDGCRPIDRRSNARPDRSRL